MPHQGQRASICQPLQQLQPPRQRLALAALRLAATAGRPAAPAWNGATWPAEPWAALPPARPLADPRAAPAPGPQAQATCLAVVDAWDACADGWLQPRALLNLGHTHQLESSRPLTTHGLGLLWTPNERWNLFVEALGEGRERPVLGMGARWWPWPGTLGLDATLTRPTTPGARTIWGLGLGWYGIKF